MKLVRNFAIGICSICLFSCSALQKEASPLEGTFWQLKTIESMDDMQYSPPQNSLYTLEFLSDRRLLVQADCNHGVGTWMQDGASVRIGPVGMTRMFCGPENFELRFLRDLDYVRTFVLRRNKLFLATLADGAILEFDTIDVDVDTANTFTYQCELSGEVAVHFNNDSNPATAVLQIGPQRLPLAQEIAASGARYQNAGFEFWEKGGSALFTSPKGAENCVRY